MMANTAATKSGFFSLVFFYLSLSHALDTIGPNGLLRQNETLVSDNGVFELGFFNYLSGYHYLGIWLKDDQNNKTVVWVANREDPILDSSGVLQIRSDGNLVLMDQRNTTILLNNDMLASSGNTYAFLLDNGNFVLYDESANIIIWQSFYQPTDTYLPEMNLGFFGLNTNQTMKKFLVSWKSPQNPAPGDFTLGIDNNGSRQLSVWQGDKTPREVGFWNGQDFRFIFYNTTNSYNFSFVSNENESYLSFTIKFSYDLSWLRVTSTGDIEESSLSDGDFLMVRHAPCEGLMGPNYEKCINSTSPTCKEGSTFSEVKGSLSSSMFSDSFDVGVGDCEIMCRNNCSCNAFASIVDPVGCQFYYGNKDKLLDIIEKGNGVVHVRGHPLTRHDGKRKGLIIMVGFASLLVFIILLSICYLGWRHSKGKSKRERDLELDLLRDQELPLLRFLTIKAATNCFASANKLGVGGFGTVYKGKLPQGQEIAVKRLCRKHGQGPEEFQNEVKLISKVQHKNLVRLLGFCIEGEEYLLVYEYLPNQSLEKFIFDSTRRRLLDWRKREKIIEGIAEGIHYLHKYSRLRIIHRDLKASNILLDGDMNPKISDFGMARIFGDETEVITKRVVGTYGYMAPEYAICGLYSEESDVFSFGVIMLELISGQRNDSMNLLKNAWGMWKDDRAVELVDSTMSASYLESITEVLRYIQIGLLCVQEVATDRPPMSDVVFMLKNGSMPLSSPKSPPILTPMSPTDEKGQCSTNRMLDSEIYAR